MKLCRVVKTGLRVSIVCFVFSIYSLAQSDCKTTSAIDSPAAIPCLLSPELPRPLPWYRDKDWLTAISTAVQAGTALLALIGAGVAVWYARRSWLASEHTLAASLRPVIGVEFTSFDEGLQEIMLKLTNVGNGVANGIYSWVDTSADATSYWNWSRWPYDDANSEDSAEQLCSYLKVQESITFKGRYPNDCEQPAFIFCAFDAVGAVIQTKAWVVDKKDGSSYIQSGIVTKTASQVQWFYDWKCLRNKGLRALVVRILHRRFAGGY